MRSCCKSPIARNLMIALVDLNHRPLGYEPTAILSLFCILFFSLAVSKLSAKQAVFRQPLCPESCAEVRSSSRWANRELFRVISG
jgi:hypothetical protein